MSNTNQTEMNYNDEIVNEFNGRRKTTGPTQMPVTYPPVSILKSDSSKGFDSLDPNAVNAKEL